MSIPTTTEALQEQEELQKHFTPGQIVGMKSIARQAAEHVMENCAKNCIHKSEVFSIVTKAATWAAVFVGMAAFIAYGWVKAKIEMGH